jgi:hypothetical protein
MREIRLSGSEGGGISDPPYPYLYCKMWAAVAICCRLPQLDRMSLTGRDPVAFHSLT